MAILAGSALAGRLLVYLNVHIQTMNAICVLCTYRLEQPCNRKLYYRSQSISFSWTFLSFATEHTYI